LVILQNNKNEGTCIKIMVQVLFPVGVKQPEPEVDH
jgi:hypothetical protein